MPKKKKLEWFPKPKSLNEIYQQTGMVFAFVSAPKDGLKVCHEWVKCRDFLHDAVRTQITGKECGIFGFKFDTKLNPPIDLRKTRMVVSKHNLSDATLPQFRQKMVSALAILNHFEKQAGVSLSKMEEIDATGSGKKAVFLFTSPRLWITSPFLVSMYTFLIRLGDKELKFKNARELKKRLKELNDRVKAGKLNDNDAQYLGASWNRLHDIIKKRNTLFPKEKGWHDIYFKDIGISGFHNNCGILSLAKAQTACNEMNKRMKEVMK